eukprot:2610890-Rhodomonas_salina.2
MARRAITRTVCQYRASRRQKAAYARSVPDITRMVSQLRTSRRTQGGALPPVLKLSVIIELVVGPLYSATIW